MYTPTFAITHKMVHYIVKLEQAISEIKDTPLVTSVRRDLLNRMAADNLHNVAKMVGAEVSFKQAEEISKGKALVSPGSKEALVNNYRSTSDFIYSASNDKYMSLSPSLFLHLNKLVFNGIVDTWEIGRFRTVSDQANPKYDMWKDKIVQRADSIDYQQHFFSVLNWFSENRYRIHPIFKIGCTLYEVLTTYPFISGNQITVFAIAELLFEKSKLSLRGMFPVSRNFTLYEDEYLEAVNLSLQKNHDQTVWLERFIRGVSLDLTALKNEVVRLEEEKVQKKKKRLLDLNSRQLKLLRHLRYKPKLTRKEYVDMMGISTMTAYRDLNELVERKLVVVRGGGRSTYYKLPDVSAKDFDEDVGQKREVVKVISDVPTNSVRSLDEQTGTHETQSYQGESDSGSFGGSLYSPENSNGSAF